MPTRFLSALIAIGVSVALLILSWPQLFGLQNAWVVAHVVSLRGLAVVGAAAGIVVLLLLLPFRPLRRLAGLLMVALLLFGVTNTAILASRGIKTDAGQASADESAAPAAWAGAASEAGTADSVTVLSWNTLGDAPGAAAIAKLALEQDADIVTLPETTEKTGVAIAEAMRVGGRPMWVHTVAFDLISKARSTTLLISPDLGDYEVKSAAGSGPPGNTNVLPTVVASPADGNGPTVVAVHAVSPIQFEMPNWRSDLDWLADQCTGKNIIMAGDFNATIDHMAGRAATDSAVLGDCRDAALSVGSAAVGTWPASAPMLLGSPIDHVLTTPNWQVDSMQVIASRDDSGSDHRPIVATLSLTP
ncbi:endonuclease/exonuclease/phosphatase family protein [Cryobacterium tagatosivorans]|uniref:Endonuclease/exonuclease/phosphatase family protein n=1 Tax=Cryobacterium tagatosivorans TaxID=1259199 RepID=A0A4R8UF98_9MICO|nr:endonuclease/exonuclease/phosphatase family protein [Cryobacterium tagatosivorans]TFB51267.1 endonuclease/exonuclease/phosphatase family protein [Cryobacterium tagatosivorans]